MQNMIQETLQLNTGLKLTSLFTWLFIISILFCLIITSHGREIGKQKHTIN